MADAEELLEWRARSPAHEYAFRDAVKLWRMLGEGLGEAPPPSRPRRKDDTN
ncbi:hypothetical protein ACQR0Z_21385 [Bradyrhizobium sp. HKCCYLS3077]|uniref:hypothetical protein n=1 Tax=Bradyrhizobium sp. HKCCYLS3077 TaxID=3420761 RepID=UPI003EBCEE79